MHNVTLASAASTAALTVGLAAYGSVDLRGHCDGDLRRTPAPPGPGDRRRGDSRRVQPERVFSEHPWDEAPSVLTERLPKPVLTAPRMLATASSDA